GIHGDVFSGDPDQIGRDIAAVIDEYGPLNLGSTNLTGYGFSALRDGIRDVKTQADNSMFFADLPVVEASTGYLVYDANSTLQLEATTAGHFIEFEFQVDVPGEYDVMLRPWRASSYARYNVLINDDLVKEI